MKSCVHLKSMRDMCWWPLENGRMHVQCCFACLWRAAARHTRERNLKPDICMCLVSTRFALRRENHMKQDSKGEIQQDILLYCHGNHTLMKSRKTINHLKKKEIKKKISAVSQGNWGICTARKNLTFPPFGDSLEQRDGCSLLKLQS